MYQDSIKTEISLETIRKKLKDIKFRTKDANKGLRLTNLQKENISVFFDIFVQNLQNIEQKSFEKYNELYVFSDEYQLTSLIKDFLSNKPFSVFACFKCRKLEKIQSNATKFLKRENKIFHRCDNEMIGEGIQTNWKSLYYLFYEDYTIRKYIIQYFTNNNKE